MKAEIRLRRREANDAADLPADLPPLLRRLYASRGVCSAADLERGVKGMLPWQRLHGIDKAVAKCLKAYEFFPCGLDYFLQ